MTDVCDLRTLRPLSFADGRCVLLVNTCVLLQLRWMDESSCLDSLSCCRLQPLPTEDVCVDQRLVRGTLFLLLSTGLTCILHHMF